MTIAVITEKRISAVSLYCNLTQSTFNHFTPKNDQFQISPVTWPVIFITQYEERGFS